MLKQQHKLLLETVFLGVVGALAAQVFTFLLRWCQYFFLAWLADYRPPGMTGVAGARPLITGAHTLWLIPVATTFGGLLAGLLVYTMAPEAEGHGTDAAVNAFHNLRGVIRTRVPFIKMIASAITIGSGGSAGREGPTALIAAGIGSVYARKRRYSEEETRLLLLVGMAAGLSAIFRSPIGTAIFAVEVLYSETDFESGALVFTMLGSIVAYAVNGLFVGFRPLFEVPAKLPPLRAVDYCWYIVLGIACGVVATILPMALYGVRDLFHMIPCPPHFKPAIAGLAVGLVAMALPQVLGGGYGWIQAAINGQIAMALLLVLAVAKIVTFSLTIGSGGSGGVFAPSLFTGAMIGGFLSPILHQPPAAFAVVGMAAVFGAAARVPIATLLMVTEMTGGYDLLAAAALAVTLASLLQTLLSASLKYKSLYEAQVPSRPYSPAHYVEDVRIALELLKTPALSKVLDKRGLELLSIVSSGVPVSLAEGKQIRIGALKPKSPCVGQPIGAGCLKGQEEVELILVLRGNRALWPHSDLRLEAGDRLVAVASEPAWSSLSDHLVKLGAPPPHKVTPGAPPYELTHESHSPDRPSAP
ncbi:MAG TPA: chloride channel protein [Bryobacteraceae bacterium]|nr:chloride channel protein [Bryobacteraceae bacterium]